MAAEGAGWDGVFLADHLVFPRADDLKEIEQSDRSVLHSQREFSSLHAPPSSAPANLIELSVNG